jgi:hypothetical protein
MAEGVNPVITEGVVRGVEVIERKAVKVVKRKASAYSKRYGIAFRKISSKYKTKAGGWMKNGFNRAQKEAHKIAKRG